MRVTGVIAEYNPLHRGHAWHLAQAREQSGADYVVAVMSTVFTQRGDAAILSPADRVRMALLAGADAVIALPVLWAVRDAEHFALGGVSLLHRLGCTHLSFGAETDAPDLLTRTAALADSDDADLHAALRAGLDAGLPHPAAMAAACDRLLPGAGALLASPNNTLGLCYLRAMRRIGSGMTAVPIRRTSDYHATGLIDALPSATAVRGAILHGDWQGVRSAVPEAAWSVLAGAAQAGRLHRPEALDQALLYRLRTLSDSELHALPGLSEGIEDRLLAVARTNRTRETLLAAAKTRRYPYARLSRLCTHALLGLTDPLPEDGPPAAWLLGFRQDAAPLLTHMKKSGFPLIGKAADIDRDTPWFAAECRAFDLWALGAGLPSGLAFTQGVVRV